MFSEFLEYVTKGKGSGDEEQKKNKEEQKKSQPLQQSDGKGGNKACHVKLQDFYQIVSLFFRITRSQRL